ncbi:branched-chain amino acid ABC transporter permease [Breoghania sp. L-A4]|uniref:branched-chain amino acid ABC transporter permease n=1 Tax=Breoghania sp. L-A4 TaxID=2304600 RepID=UPI000E3609FA|nr:branched-chain amino acid ABC transporter permease [Breoghania sp. L-A4]AXS42158.1 branched-chain amino acid ABC transporter permease [Breoghania sp. L-A4]
MSVTYTIERATRASRISAVTFVLLVGALAAAPLWAGRSDMRLMAELYSYLALASLWNLLAGYTGLVSVGQQAFVGFGGYMLFALAMFFGVHPLAAIPLAGVLSVLVAAPVGALIFRLRGAYFAIGTWVVAEVFRLVFAQVQSLGGGSGISLPIGVVKALASSRDGREWTVYWLALALAVAVLLLVYWLLRSRPGLALTAIRDDETASQSVGIDIWRTKFMVYLATAGATGMIGALIFLQKLRISPDAAFSINDWTAYVIFITVIGGIGRIEGPIVGTLVFFALRETLADLGTVYLLILGAVAIAIMLKAPKGLWGYIADRSGLELFPVRRRVVATGASEGTS